jgi:hypothetical protein
MVLLAIGVREPFLWKLMVGRALMLGQIASLVLVGLWAVRALASGGVRGLAGVAVLVVVVIWPFASWPAIVSLTVLLPAAAMIALCRCDKDRASSWGWSGAALAGAGVLALGLFSFIDRPYPWLRSGQDPAWLEAQRWARQHSAPGTVFVTPPYLSGWRFQSHRPTYGQLKDGGLLFYAGLPVLDWEDRMGRLGMVAPLTWFEEDSVEETDAARILAERYARALSDHADLDGSFVVLERDHDATVGPEVWSNEQFVIRSLTTARTGSSGQRGPGSRSTPAPRPPR